MNSTEDIVLKSMFGKPVFIKDICAVFPATLEEIAFEGYETFQEHLQILFLPKPSDGDLSQIVEGLTDFQYLLLMTTLDTNFLLKFKEAFNFFTHENVMFSMDNEKIIIGPLSEQHLMGEDDFEEFKKVITIMYRLENLQNDENEIRASDSEFVKALKRQQAENRKKLKKAKKVGKNAGQEDLRFSDLIGSLACGLNISIAEVGKITYYAFYDQLKRMGWHEEFDINNRAALAGAKLKQSQLKHWIKSMYGDNK